MPDNDGYPTEEELERIRAWPYDDALAFITYLKTVFYWPEHQIEEWDDHDNRGRPVHNLTLHTGGWSGNEDIMEALQSNLLFWSLFWVSSYRGGHYRFEIPKILKEDDE